MSDQVGNPEDRFSQNEALITDRSNAVVLLWFSLLHDIGASFDAAWQIILSLVKVAWYPPSVNELFTQFTVSTQCKLSIFFFFCNSSYFSL